MSYWEEQVYLSGELSLLDRIDETAVFKAIGNAFPTTGTKIDWSVIRRKRLHFSCMTDERWLEAAMGSIIDFLPVAGRTIHVGDGHSPWGVIYENSRFMSTWKLLADIPEHHYFVGEGFTWLAVVSMEGDVDFVPGEFATR